MLRYVSCSPGKQFDVRVQPLDLSLHAYPSALCCGCLFISDLKASERQCSFDNQVISVDVQEDMLQSLPKLLDFFKKQ